MKKLILGIAGIALIVTACEKEKQNIINQTSDGSTSINNESGVLSDSERPTENSGNRAGAPRTWYDYSQTPPYGPDDYGCLNFAGDCFNTVVVTSSQNIMDFGEIFKVVTLNDRDDIVDIFTTYQSLLEESMDRDHIAAVLAKNLVVSCKGDFDKETAYLILKRQGRTVAVYPYEQ